ncbi:facilitated trehalose transporter Tret1 isoform X1 [Halyomorpha halys]|uniref:facilitated trehalose transporter Tret1 isoform X1 n=2 Tax=Halyomorpha halys TaxID=286706 RepID=UPI0006D4CD65|nr:facilitated trehalose transporter Tret1-like [Halyomorpha halys]
MFLGLFNRGLVRQVVVSTISQLSVFVSGAAYCWFEPLTLRLKEDPNFMMTTEGVSWLIALVEFGAVLSPILAGYLSDWYGRKAVVLSVGPICVVGWVMAVIWKNIWVLGIMRILHGVAVGIGFTVAPIYTAEIADPKLRGALSGTFQIALYTGALYVFCTGPYLNYDNFIYTSLPVPIVFTIIFSFCPETPYYFLMGGKEEKAKEVLMYFRDSTDVDEEIAQMKAAVEEETSDSSSWRTLFFDRGERKAFIIVNIVCIAKFMTGMPVIANYAVETFSMASSFLPPEEMSIVLMGMLAGIAVLAAFLSDWFGRKPLLLVSCFGCLFAHLLTGLYFYIHEKTSYEAQPWMMYLGIVLYCFFSDIGLGPLLQTLLGEMFGANTRGLAGGITEGLGGVWSFIALKAYSPVNETFGVYLNFWFYSGVSFVSGVILWIMLYETAGKTIGEKKKIDKSPS